MPAGSCAILPSCSTSSLGKSVFDERDIAKILASLYRRPRALPAIDGAIILNPRRAAAAARAIDFATGDKLPARYTTRALIRLEAEMARQAIWLSKREGRGVSHSALDATFRGMSGFPTSRKPRSSACAGPARIAAVVGRAGAGKTTMMKAAREAWELAGYRVVGGALAGKAAEGLEKEAGIQSRTLASWELRWNRGRDGLDDKTIFVMDEAGMVASKQMAGFVDAVVRAGARSCWSAIPSSFSRSRRVLPSALSLIASAMPNSKLSIASAKTWMRAASLDLARGNVEKALSAYGANVRITGERLKVRSCRAPNRRLEPRLRSDEDDTSSLPIFVATFAMLNRHRPRQARRTRHPQ
jgi:ATP-dependent exoDNAse (exonuclease V) alpha subunit